jgi:hypothetical protein
MLAFAATAVMGEIAAIKGALDRKKELQRSGKWNSMSKGARVKDLLKESLPKLIGL